MNDSLGSLIIALVGVLGTLLSGFLAHRSGLRSRLLEIEFAEQQRRDEQRILERRDDLALRRSMYVSANQALRNFHAELGNYRRKVAQGEASSEDLGSLGGSRAELYAVIAEAQMIVSDDVLKVIGELSHHMSRTYLLLESYGVGSRDGNPVSLEDVKVRLSDSSKSLYEVRQVMRNNLGITRLPIERPEGYGAS